MESSEEEVKRSTQVITIQPNETVLTAFPYGPHTSLLDVLKGEPRVLGAIQILLALIIAGIGAIFAFNYLNFAQRFPLVFFIGYPFWGAFTFIIAGYVTGSNGNRKCLGQGVTSMNAISSFVAAAGILFTIISYRYQHKYCQVPSLEGTCAISRALYSGILSVLLIISIVELSISVTVISFRSNCLTRSNEIVFFLPSDVAQDRELSATEENAIIQFELQEESASDVSTTNIQPVFFGGYIFFKLTVTKNSLAFQHAGRRGSISYCTASLSESGEQQKYLLEPLSLYDREPEFKTLPPVFEKKSSEITTDTEQLSDEDLQAVTAQFTRKKIKLQQDKPLPTKVSPSYPVKITPYLPPQALPSQDLPEQVLLSETPTSHVTKSNVLKSKDTPSQHIPSKNTQSQATTDKYLPSLDMYSQDISLQRQVLPVKALPFEAPKLLDVHSSNMQHLDQQSLDLKLQNIQSQEHKSMHLLYQDIKSEVKLLTEEWKSEEELYSKRSSKQHFQYQESKDRQSLKQKSLDLQIQDQQAPRRKSLDKHIKDRLSPNSHYVDKQVQTSPQFPYQQTEDLQAQEEKTPKQVSQDLQFQIQKYHDWQSPDWKIQNWQTSGQQSQNWRTQNKEWKTQEWQFEMQHSQNWESQAWQTRDQLVKESQNQRALFQETQTVHAVIPPHLDEQSQDIPHQDSQYQDKDQLDLQSTGIQKEDLEKDAMQIRDVKPQDTSCGSQSPSDLQSQDTKPDLKCPSYQRLIQDLQSTGIQKDDLETDAVHTGDINPQDMSCGSQSPSDIQSGDMKPDFKCSSYQSSVQDTYFTYMSNINSEQDVQQNISTCSTAYKEDVTSTASDPKERQQSED
ncbi:membrane-spanning 4-domains subfamily A member 14 [Phacochoerus africanus]|uniref:membrane-spanning 4-domains subfamily A member 14 n=1 Tax=Phacochoerus africanus TaxID=41426 RepID=UPI001FD94490|nr:membrane-spanning 4-domains subfamily A member 14 [Phacochoerus africanus]